MRKCVTSCSVVFSLMGGSCFKSAGKLSDVTLGSEEGKGAKSCCFCCLTGCDCEVTFQSQFQDFDSTNKRKTNVSSRETMPELLEVLRLFVARGEGENIVFDVFVRLIEVCAASMRTEKALFAMML